MSEFDSLLQGMNLILTPGHIGLMVIGVLLGILVGVLPGLGAPNGVALLLPLTCLAARSLRSCSIFPVSPHRWRRRSTATRWPAKAVPPKP